MFTKKEKSSSLTPKILLINPPYTLEERYGKNLKHFGGNAEPLGLAYIAAAALQDGHEVEIIDAPVQNFTSEMIQKKIINEKIELVGFTMLTPMYNNVKRIVGDIKQNCPETIIVIGGAHASALPEETISDIKNDIVCIGEGENTFREIAKAIEEKKDLTQIKGICFRQNNQIIRTAPRPFEKSLDVFPPPARHLLPMDKYFLTATRVKKSGYCGTVIVARGCPFGCSYCSHPFGRTFRAHSPERIVNEINELIEKYGAVQINLEADTLTINKDFIMSLCDKMIENNIHKKIKWTCESRIDTLSEEMLVKMKEAGCWQISIGVESGVDRLLKIINKGETKKEIEEKVKIIHKVGISIRAFFMLGLPSETREDSFETIKFAQKLNPDWAQFTITIPYPGTPLFDILKKSEEINSFDWKNYKTWGGWTEDNIPYITKGRTLEELKSMQKYALKKFYLRPSMFIKFFKRIDSFATLKKYIIGLLILLKVNKSQTSE